MEFAGEYVNAQSRTGWMMVPAVSGYTTGRLEAVPAINPSGYAAEQTVKFTLENTGSQAVTIQFVGTDNYISGPRTNLGSAVTVAAGGVQVTTLIPVKRYLELKTTSGTSQVKLQLESRIRFETLSFKRDESIYPSALWKPVGLPTPPTW